MPLSELKFMHRHTNNSSIGTSGCVYANFSMLLMIVQLYIQIYIYIVIYWGCSGHRHIMLVYLEC